MYGLYHKPRDDPIIMDIPENATFSLLSADYNSDGRDDLNVTINTDLESITYTIYQTTKKASSTSINGLYHKPRDDPITIKH